jgi:hypothetical protein
MTVTIYHNPACGTSRVDNGRAETDHAGEAGIGFVAAHSHSFELFQLAEEVFDEAAPFINLRIDPEWLSPTRMLKDDDLGAAFRQVGNDGVCVETLVGDQTPKFDIFDQRRNANRIEALTRQENTARDCPARRSVPGFGRQTTSRLTYGLALSPPFAPCRWR